MPVSKPIPVDDPMGGDGFFCVVTGIHGPADHAGGHARAEDGGDGSVGSDTTSRDLAGHFMHQVEEGFVFAAGGCEDG